jgi:hypothetical protein
MQDDKQLIRIVGKTLGYADASDQLSELSVAFYDVELEDSFKAFITSKHPDTTAEFDTIVVDLEEGTICIQVLEGDEEISIDLTIQELFEFE